MSGDSNEGKKGENEIDRRSVQRREVGKNSWVWRNEGRRGGKKVDVLE